MTATAITMANLIVMYLISLVILNRLNRVATNTQMYFSNSTLLFFHSSKFLTTCSAPVTRKVAKTLARGIPADP